MVAALDELTAIATERREAGGARLKVRLVKGANLAMEQVEAELHGWTQAPYGSKAEVDAAYLRLVDRALDPARTSALRVGVAVGLLAEGQDALYRRADAALYEAKRDPTGVSLAP